MLPGPTLVFKCPKCENFTTRGSLLSGNTMGARMFSDGKIIAEMLPEFPAITKCWNCNTFYWLDNKNYAGKLNRREFLLKDENGNFIDDTEYWDEEIEIPRSRRSVEEFGLTEPIKTTNRQMMLDLGANAESFYKKGFEYTLKDESGNSIDITNKKWKSAHFLSIEEYFETISTNVFADIKDEKFLRIKLWQSFNDRTRNGEELFRSEKSKVVYEANCERLTGILNHADINEKLMMAECYRNLGKFDECRRILETISDEKYLWQKEQIKNECYKNNRKVIELIQSDDGGSIHLF